MLTGRNTPKGKQVAWNKQFHNKIVLHTNAEGEYYAICQRIDTPSLIRSEYVPIGVQLVCPVKWGHKRGAEVLLEYKIADAEKQLEQVQAELVKLKACLADVQKWDDDSKV